MDGYDWMDGRVARRTGEWGRKAGVREWTGWMDTIGWTGGWPDGRVNGAGRRGWVSGLDECGDHWMDGRVAGRMGERDGKAGVREWTGWMDGDDWMDGQVARRTGEWGRKAGVGEWTGWMDGDDWVDGQVARRTGERDGKAGVGEWTGWMER